jgi:hypothetical protein
VQVVDQAGNAAGGPYECVGSAICPARVCRVYKSSTKHGLSSATVHPLPPCETSTMTVPEVTNSAPTGVFFAYPGSPELIAESMRTASTAMRGRGIDSSVWQDLPIEGRLMIQQVLAEIEKRSTVIAEIGSLNSNVLFELGYGIAKDKHVWAVLDETDTIAAQNWRDFGLLQGVGRVDYEGSSEALLRKFSQARPDLAGTDTLWAELYAKIRSPRVAGSLFNYATGARDDAAKAVALEASWRSCRSPFAQRKWRSQLA